MPVATDKTVHFSTTLFALIRESLDIRMGPGMKTIRHNTNKIQTSGYAMWFTAGGAIRIAHYDVIDDVITRKV